MVLIEMHGDAWGYDLLYNLKPRHMHNIHPGANIHPGCKCAPGVYFGHVNGVL